MRKHFFNQFAIMLMIASIVNTQAINEIIRKEKDILIQLQHKIKERLNLIKIYEESNSKKEKSKASENYCNIGNLESTTCVKLLEIKSNNTNIKIKSLLNIPQSTLDEGIINFFMINLNKQNKSTRNINLLCNSNLEIKSQFLILFLTNSNIHITDSNGSLLTSQSLNITKQILESDFSQFEEESSITLYLKDKTISLIKVEMNIILSESYSDIKVDLAVISSKSANLYVDSESGLSSLNGHKIHGNKYIIASFANGEVFVLNQELELISNISLNRISSRLLINNGIISAISKNEMIFLNLLGGNSVLLVCHSHYDIVDSAYDMINGLLYVIDTQMNLLIYEIKLSMSKQNTNECYVIYKLKLNLNRDYAYEYAKTANINNAKLILTRNILYIFVGSSYMAVIYLPTIMERGANNVLNEYMFIQNGTMASNDYSTINAVVFNSNCPVTSFNQASSFALINLKEEIYVLVELINTKANVTDSNAQSAANDSFFSFEISDLFTKYMLVVYLIIIIIFSAIAFFYKINNKSKAISTPNGIKKYANENEQIFEHIFDNVKGFENQQIIKSKTTIVEKHSQIKKLNRPNCNILKHQYVNEMSDKEIKEDLDYDEEFSCDHKL